MCARMSVAQWRPTLCGLINCSLPGSPLSVEFSRQEYWSGLPFPTLGDLPDPGIESRSLALWADSLQSEPTGKPPCRIGWTAHNFTVRWPHCTRSSCPMGKWRLKSNLRSASQAPGARLSLEGATLSNLPESPVWASCGPASLSPPC